MPPSTLNLSARNSRIRHPPRLSWSRCASHRMMSSVNWHRIRVSGKSTLHASRRSSPSIHACIRLTPLSCTGCHSSPPSAKKRINSARIRLSSVASSGRSLPRTVGSPRAQFATSERSASLSGSKSPSQRPRGSLAGRFGRSVGRPLAPDGAMALLAPLTPPGRLPPLAFAMAHPYQGRAFWPA